VIDSTFPLDQVQAAHERLDAADRFGKIVLAIDEERVAAS
jgi:NADPH:quinone reductase-like Zn-dependent oxidoreductase